MTASTEETPSRGRQMALGLAFGLMFGFLLQKAGVAKYAILMGVLLLEDFTVFKVMLSAIVVGMIGVFTMHRLGMVKLHPKPLRLGGNIAGGLIFGVGFGLLGYCPGTNAAAIGQGNFDALAGLAGLLLGSHLFAETSGVLSRTLLSWGDRGKLLLPDVLRLPALPIAAGAATLLALALAALELWGPTQ